MEVIEHFEDSWVFSIRRIPWIHISVKAPSPWKVVCMLQRKPVGNWAGTAIPVPSPCVPAWQPSHSLWNQPVHFTAALQGTRPEPPLVLYFCGVHERAGSRLFIDHKPHFKTRDKKSYREAGRRQPWRWWSLGCSYHRHKGGEARPYFPSLFLCGNVFLDIRPWKCYFRKLLPRPHQARMTWELRREPAVWIWLSHSDLCSKFSGPWKVNGFDSPPISSKTFTKYLALFFLLIRSPGIEAGSK